MSRRIDRRTVLGVMLVVLLSAGALMAADPGAPGEITFVGKNAFATANGTFHVWRVVDRSIDLDDPGASWAEVEIDLSSVDTGIERRDDHLRDPDFFEIEAWPLARVRAHSLVSADVDEEGRPRFAVRFAVVRGARAALSVLPGPLAGLGGGAIGALFDAVEHELARRGATRAAPVRPDAAIEILRAAARGPRR